MDSFFGIAPESRHVVRRLERPLRDWLARAEVDVSARDRLALVIDDAVTRVKHQRYFRVSLDRDAVEFVNPYYEPAVIALAPGVALVNFDTRHADTSELVISVHPELSANVETLEELMVARDAYLGGDVAASTRLARRAFPHGYAIFDLLLRIEQKHL